jgi:hypothetical protein
MEARRGRLCILAQSAVCVAVSSVQAIPMDEGYDVNLGTTGMATGCTAIP